jgi:hypothetical protein
MRRGMILVWKKGEVKSEQRSLRITVAVEARCSDLMETDKYPTLTVLVHGGKARVAHYDWSPLPQTGQPKLTFNRRIEDLSTGRRSVHR